MKKNLIIVSLIIILIVIVMSIFLKKQYKDRINNKIDFATTFYKLESKNYKLLVADTPEKRERGLMFFRKLDGVDGMIFIFPDKNYRTFWNKNTLLDLKLLWIDDDSIVGESFLPSIEKSKEIVIVNSPKPADKVIELPAEP